MARETYTIEPPKEKRDQMSRDRKLDQILDILTHRESGEPDGGTSPEVTFEPDPEQLPTEAEMPKDDDEETDPAGQGEGTANVSDQRRTERKFRFPGARRSPVMER